jgi:hypothetical protein
MPERAGFKSAIKLAKKHIAGVLKWAFDSKAVAN